MSKPNINDKIKHRTAAASINRYTPTQLPFWAEEKRAIANELARCPLFRCGNGRKPREYFDKIPLVVLGSGGVTYTGEELRWHDEDVFLALAHAARLMSAENLTVKISSSQICKLTGHRQSQHYYTEIYNSIQRMKGSVITVFSARLTKALACEKAREEGAAPEVLERLYADLVEFERREELKLLTPQDKISGLMMSLIEGDTLFTDGATVIDGIPQGNLQWTIKLNRRMVTLFAAPYLTHMDFEARKLLSPGARRLQAYFCSHGKPHEVLVESLAEMLALDQPTKELNRTMRRYLDELLAVGVLATGELVDAAGPGKKKVKVTRPTQNDPPQT